MTRKDQKSSVQYPTVRVRISIFIYKFMNVLRKYLLNLLISLDQLANTILGGDPDETISSRAGKRQRKGKLAYWLCRALHWIDPNHCRDAIEEDEGKNSLNSVLRDISPSKTPFSEKRKKP